MDHACPEFGYDPAAILIIFEERCDLLSNRKYYDIH
jgi:hypothetical protein